jgi:hypothetical protein
MVSLIAIPQQGRRRRRDWSLPVSPHTPRLASPSDGCHKITWLRAHGQLASDYLEKSSWSAG